MKRLSLFIACLLLIQGTVMASDHTSTTAEKLALALISGRAITAQNQGLINDASKGDKGLTADLFIEKLTAHYKTQTGIDLATIKPTSDLDKLLLAYVDAVRIVLNDAQDQINEQGKGFKGFIPAVFGRKAGKKFREMTGIRLKQTSTRYRNRANKPDEFETRILTKFESPEYNKGDGIGMVASHKGEEVYRYMQPIYIKEACLKCHGNPVGELDIAGRKKEGYKVGDVRGAISVILPISMIK